MAQAHVTVHKFSELSGLTVNAIRALIKKGQWREKIDYFRAPNGRIFINTERAVKWQEGIQG